MANIEPRGGATMKLENLGGVSEKESDFQHPGNFSAVRTLYCYASEE